MRAPRVFRHCYPKFRRGNAQLAMFTGVASKAPSTVEVLEEVQPGDGKRFPKTGDKVVVHYTGSLRSAAPEAPGCSSDHRVRAVSQE